MLTDSQKWLVLALVVGLGWLLYRLSPVMTPFAVSALLAYLGDPLADRLEKMRRFNRTAAVSVVFLLMTLLLVLFLLIIVPLMENQISRLVVKMPQYLNWIKDTVIPWLQNLIGLEASQLELSQITHLLRENWQQAGGVAAAVVSYVSRSGAALLGWVANLVLIPVVTFYLLRDWDQLVAAVHQLIPRHLEPTLSQLAGEADERMSAFIRGQLGVMLALGLIYSIGLWIAGIDLAFLIGMGAGLLSFIPYLGSIVGFAAAIVVSVVPFDGWWGPIAVCIVFIIGQAMEGMLLTPWLVGDKIGLHPVAVIFAVLAGGQLFGFFGILLALPVAAVLMVLLRHAHEWYKSSRLYERDPVKIEEP